MNAKPIPGRPTRNHRRKLLLDALEPRQHMAADLVVESVRVVSGPTDPGQKDSAITLEYKVANRGNSASGPFSVGPFQSSDPITARTERELVAAHRYTNGLSAGASHTTTITYTPHWGYSRYDTDNTGYLCFDVDFREEVAESNESNNFNRGAGIDYISFRYDAHLGGSSGMIATPIPANGIVNGTLGDELTWQRDIDVYSVDCVGGRPYEADIDSPSFGGVDTSIRVYDANFNLVVSNGDGGYDGRSVDPYVQWGAGVSGKYYIVVSAKQNENADPRTITNRNDGGTGSYSLLVRQSQIPTVKLNITSGISVEGDATKPVKLTLSRSNGSIDRDLFVKWETYGSASTADLPISVDGITIPAGQSSVTVTLQPHADGISEQLEYLVVNLLGDQRYVRDAVSSSAVIYIQDDPATDLPDVNGANLAWDTTEGTWYTLSFDQNITGFAADDLTLTNLTTNTPVTGFGTYSVTGQLYGVNFRNFAGKTLPDGRYRLTLKPDAVSNAGGRKNAVQHFDFHVLAGDANHDGRVGFEDLLVLGQNYGASGKTFSAGNFNYDAQGKVDFNDLLVLGQRYGTNLGLPAIVAAPEQHRTEATSKARTFGEWRIASEVL